MDRRTALVVATFAFSLISADLAGAHYQMSQYSWRDGCNGDSDATRVDPVGIIFYGQTATDTNTRSRVEVSMSWARDPNWSGRTPPSYTPQWMESHGFCTRMDGESQNGSDLSSRTHLRYNQNHHRNADGRWYTASTPHYDLRVYCGHRAESFNWAKYYIVGGMYDYGFREVTYSYFGNTRLLWQCDGTADRSDGQVAWIRIG
jgi:hypothetical protein